MFSVWDILYLRYFSFEIFHRFIQIFHTFIEIFPLWNFVHSLKHSTFHKFIETWLFEISHISQWISEISHISQWISRVSLKWRINKYLKYLNGSLRYLQWRRINKYLKWRRINESLKYLIGFLKYSNKESMNFWNISLDFWNIPNKESMNFWAI